MGMFLERDFPRLIDLVYDAALDGRRWQPFIDGVSECFGGAGGIIYCFNRERAVTTDFVTKFNCDIAFTVPSLQNYLRINPYTPATQARHAVGTVNLVSEEAGRDRTGRSAACDVPAEHLNLPLCSSDERLVVLAVSPSPSMLRKHLETYRQRLELLAPHFIRALKLAQQLSNPPLKPMLEGIRASAVVLDASDHIVATNRLGDELFRVEQVFTLDRLGELHAAELKQAARFKAAIAAARAGTSAPVKLSSRATGRSYLVWIVPLTLHSDQKPWREAEQRIQFLGLEGGKGSVLLLACDLHEATGISYEDLMTGFGLTRAEARLTSALVAGRSLGDYAREAGLSRNTARNQLATIFDKTGTRRQTALVAHITGTV